MLHSLALKLHDDKITVTSTDGQFIKDGIAVVAFDDKEKVLSVGETSEYVQEKSPAECEQLKSKIHFSYPFLINDFHPKLAGISVNYWAYLASHISAESQKRILKDSTDLQITIVDYERLEKDVRELFEYYVQKSWMVKVKRLSINGQSKVLVNFGWAEWALRISVLAIFLVLCFLTYEIAQKTMGAQLSAPIPKDSTFLSFVSVIAVFGFIIYFGLFISVAMWKIAVKNFLSDAVSEAMIENANLGLPKRIVKLLRRKPFTQNGGG